MTEKKYLKKVKRLGGDILSGCVVDFPDTLQIKTKKDAIDIIDIMRYGNDLDTDLQYTVNLDTPLEKLKEAIKNWKKENKQ